MPKLYLVGTPIGNLEDISFRAIRILQEVSLIAAEDTRVTRKLLERYEIKTRLISFHEYSDSSRVDELLDMLETADVALVSDAGMPGLSDPGYPLVEACIRSGVEVVPIPGASAVVTALIASGLPTEKFLYLGFLPRRKQARRQAIADVKALGYTLVLFEAPQRLIAALGDLRDILGDRQISIGREMTKLHEEFWRGSLSDSIQYFSAKEILGELTLVIEGAHDDDVWDEELVIEALERELSAGLSRKEAAERVADFSRWKKRDIYRLSLTLDQE